MDVEYLLLPVLPVVGEPSDEPDVELVAMFPRLAAAVLYPSEHDDMMYDVPQHVELDDLPTLALPYMCSQPVCCSVPRDLAHSNTSSQHTQALSHRCT